MGTLVSVTVSVSLPEASPVALAVNVAVWVPSTTWLLIVPTANVTEVAPAGIVTVAGTVTSFGSELAIVTWSGFVVSVLRVTVAVVALVPAASLTVWAASASVSPPARLVGWAATAVLLAVFELEDLAERVLADHEPVIPGGQQLGDLHVHRPGDRLARRERAGKGLGGQQGRVVAGRIGRQEDLLGPGPGGAGRSAVGQGPVDGTSARPGRPWWLAVTPLVTRSG